MVDRRTSQRRRRATAERGTRSAERGTRNSELGTRNSSQDRPRLQQRDELWDERRANGEGARAFGRSTLGSGPASFTVTGDTAVLVFAARGGVEPAASRCVRIKRERCPWPF